MPANKKTPAKAEASKRIPKITPQPRPRPDLANVLDEIERYVQRFIVFPSTKTEDETMTLGQARSTAVTLWIAHANLLDAFGVTPRLLVTSAEPDSGKTTVGEVVCQLTGALMSSNVSPAALYRAVEAEMASVIVCDEFDSIYGGAKSERSEELRTFINAGYKRGSPVIRCVGKNFEARSFDTFAAVALCGLDNGRTPDTITTRSIPIKMKSKLSTEHVEDFEVGLTAVEEATRLHELLGA